MEKLGPGMVQRYMKNSPPVVQMSIQSLYQAMAHEEKHVQINQFKTTNPSSQLQQPLTTQDGLQHQIDVCHGNTKNIGELQCYAMQTKATSGEGRERGKDAEHFEGKEEKGDNRESHEGQVREAHVQPRGGEGGNQRQQHPGRPSGWDILPPGFGMLDANLHGAAVFGAGSVSDRRSYSSRKMDVGPFARRNKRQTTGHMGRPYPPPRKREGLVMNYNDRDTTPCRLPCSSSPDSSETYFSPPVEVFSPLHSVGHYQTGLDVSINTFKAGTPNSLQGESEPTSNIHGDPMVASECLRDEDMELDRAMVLARKAPRAP